VQQSPAAPPIVEIRKLSFGYDRSRPVLRDINLEIPRGSVVGIMGQSGCGKTTLLRVIMGALRPSAGEANVLGHTTRTLDTDGLYAMRRKMGMLFQFGALFTDMSVYENVAFPLREHDERYAYSAEWVTILKRIYSETKPFDHDGNYFSLKNVEGKPKPWHHGRPMLMSAGSSPAGRSLIRRRSARRYSVMTSGSCCNLTARSNPPATHSPEPTDHPNFPSHRPAPHATSASRTKKQLQPDPAQPLRVASPTSRTKILCSERRRFTARGQRRATSKSVSILSHTDSAAWNARKGSRSPSCGPTLFRTP